ncbi:MAG: enzyme of heme biosynthesis [Alistipes sp.]|jgi:tetratricopeptide (TPR) repeat protein|nr:enzyme of heme biosynthesis [Alistipes sp.]
MKKIIKMALAAATVFAAGAPVMAQNNALEDPRWGGTPEDRQENLKRMNFLRDEVTAKNWDDAAGYIRELMNGAPSASSNLYLWGVQVYKGKLSKVTTAEDKARLVDSIMLIYDRRAQYYGSDPNRGTAYILKSKAQDYANLNPMDRPNVRKFFKDAVDAPGAQSDVVLMYFQQLVTDFRGVEISPEELLGEYQRLAPMVENESAEVKDGLTGLLATSGAADCNVLEDLYTKELAANPGDTELLTKAYNLMSMAGCDSPFYISVAEQYYAAAPSSAVAIRLATLFEQQQQYEKALQYLNEMVETETDPAAKANLYVRMAASELGLRHASAAAQAARQAIQLNGNNGYAHMFLAEAYIGGASGCSGFQAQTVFWLAYDALSRARDAFEGDATLIESVNSRMANCRANFPTFEDGFMNVQGYENGKAYTVSCGWVSGSTMIRSR